MTKGKSGAKSGAKGKGKKGGKKGKKGTSKRLLLGAGLLLLGWYLYTRSKKAKQENALKQSMGSGAGIPPMGSGSGIPMGSGMGSGGGYGEPVHPDTGVPCSQVFGGCPTGGVSPPSGGGVPPSYPPTYPSGTTVYGCKNSGATNYNPIATVDDNSCTFGGGSTVYGCTNDQAENYNPLATSDDNSCTFGTGSTVYGCTNDQASNYDPLATVDDQSCTFGGVYGCTNPSANNYDANATNDDNSCTFDPATIDGCTDSGATNYDASATNDDGSCTYPTGSCPVDSQGNATNTPNYDCSGVVNGNDTSCCCLNDIAIDCWTACPNPQSQTFMTQGCGVADSCGDSTGFPLSAEPMCAQPINGCTDPSAYNYNPSATNNDGTCCLVAGCMTQGASNYDPNACHDDGSCASLPVLGCTDPNATNYNPSATQNDNSCTYPPEQFRCDAGSCLSCGYNVNPTNCPHYENTCANSCNVAQTQNLSCWTGCNPQSTAVPVNGVGLSATCETVDWTEALYSSQQTCQAPQMTCYQCDGNNPVGNQFAQANECPKGWQSTPPSCQMVDCSTCNGGSPMSNMFSGSCPTGWQLTSLGNPCPPNNGGGQGVGAHGGAMVDCSTCDGGYPMSNMFSGSCPTGWQLTSLGNPCPPNNGGAVAVGLGGNQLLAGVGQQAQAQAGVGQQAQVSAGVGQQAQVSAQQMKFSGFAGQGKSFGEWQRTMANKIMINDLDWNPITSD